MQPYVREAFQAALASAERTELAAACERIRALVHKAGVPCIVGTRTATQVLRDGELITMDGSVDKVPAASAPRPTWVPPGSSL